MTHIEQYNDYEQKLIALLQEYGLELDPQQTGQIIQHLDYVLEKNQTTNLTRITDFSEALIKHVVDSLIPLKTIPLSRSDSSIRFIDIGTGAGFPGVPITLSTTWQGTLIDSVKKKIDALNDIVQHMGLNRIEAICDRVENYALQKPNAYNLVISRAVGELSVLLEYASPLLTMNGILCALKALPSCDEIEHAKSVEMLCGFENVSRETFELPNSQGVREVFVYKKVAQASITLPRRVGMATKRPLYKFK